MARQQKLKVFRTAAGFHDAYVAAPSQKAALKAWGAQHNLFSSGDAEQVDDPALSKEPLANPGVVIRRLRGSAEEQMAELDRQETARQRDPKPKARNTSSSKPAKAKAPKPKPVLPKPKRDDLTAAEKAIGDEEERYRQAAQDLAEREKELARERADLDQSYKSQITQLRDRRDKERRAYEAAMEEWAASR